MATDRYVHEQPLPVSHPARVGTIARRITHFRQFLLLAAGNHRKVDLRDLPLVCTSHSFCSIVCPPTPYLRTVPSVVKHYALGSGHLVYFTGLIIPYARNDPPVDRIHHHVSYPCRKSHPEYPSCG